MNLANIVFKVCALLLLVVGATTSFAALMLMPNTADHISYVISPEGKVLYVYSSQRSDNHVENTMKAVEQWRASAPK